MTRQITKFIIDVIAILVYMIYIVPWITSMLYPETFWQKLVMLFTIYIPSFLIFVGGITIYINKIIDIFNGN